MKHYRQICRPMWVEHYHIGHCDDLPDRLIRVVNHELSHMITEVLERPEHVLAVCAVGPVGSGLARNKCYSTELLEVSPEIPYEEIELEVLQSLEVVRVTKGSFFMIHAQNLWLDELSDPVLGVKDQGARLMWDCEPDLHKPYQSELGVDDPTGPVV